MSDFKKISKAYSDHSILMHEAIAQKAGLSGTDHKYLGLMMEFEALTAGDISEITGLTTGAVTGLIDRLEKKGLVKRKMDKTDRRKVWIIPQKTQILNLLEPVFTELQIKTQAFIATFSENEMEVVKRYFVGATEIMKETAQHLKK